MKKLTVSLIFLLALSAWAKTKEAERLQNAAEALKEIMAAPDKGIPGDTLAKAQCIAIIPGMKKLAIGFGGQHGKGAVSCRHSGGWGPPSMLSLSGGSFGLQLGAQSTDVIMLIMTKRGMESLTKDKFEVGGDLSAAAGPVGRDATANTDIAMNAEIYTYSRSRGLFAGISLKGAVVSADKDANKVIYGRAVDAQHLLSEGGIAPPADAKPLMDELGKYPGKK